MKCADLQVLPGTGRGTARSAVEGLAVSQNMGEHSLDIAKNLNRRDPQSSEPLFHQPLISRFISRGPRGTVMCPTIHLDGQSRLHAREVENIRACPVLPAESEAARLMSKHLPQQNFGQGH